MSNATNEGQWTIEWEEKNCINFIQFHTSLMTFLGKNYSQFSAFAKLKELLDVLQMYLAGVLLLCVASCMLLKELL